MKRGRGPFCKKGLSPKTLSISEDSAGRRSFAVQVGCGERSEPHLSRNEREISIFIVRSAPDECDGANATIIKSF